jgi:hypothetical protein
MRTPEAPIADSVRCRRTEWAAPTTTREPAILGMATEPTDETSSSEDGSLTDMAEVYSRASENDDGAIRSPARS